MPQSSNDDHNQTGSFGAGSRDICPQRGVDAPGLYLCSALRTRCPSAEFLQFNWSRPEFTFSQDRRWKTAW